VNKLKKKLEVEALQFEDMIDRLEKGSGQQVIKKFPTYNVNCRVKNLTFQSVMLNFKLNAEVILPNLSL